MSRSPAARALATLVLLLVGVIPDALAGQPWQPAGEPFTTGPLTVTPIDFDPRGEQPPVSAELGYLVVPERHAEPGGATLRIRFVRFPATTARPGPPIVYLAGGPGGLGTSAAAGARFELFTRLRDVADVIALDQRGTGGAEPFLACPGVWSYPADRPMGPAVLSSTLSPWVDTCVRHWSDRVELSAYTTVESTGDLDAVRRALGSERISLWGISYGTHLALAYLRNYPDRVDRAVLAGVEGPDHTYKLPRTLDRILAAVETLVQADRRVGGRVPNLESRLRATLDRLDRVPQNVMLFRGQRQVRLTLGGDDLRRALFASLSSRDGIEGILEWLVPALDGDFAALAARAMAFRTGNRGLAMTYAMDCASGASAERMARIARQKPGATIGGVANYLLDAVCPLWPGRPLSDAFRAPLFSNVPTLFISGSLDPRTPTTNADEVGQGFDRRYRLDIVGASHGDDLLISDPAIGDEIVGFLAGGVLTRPRITLQPLRFRLPTPR